MEYCIELAKDIAKFSKDFDPYEYADSVSDEKDYINKLFTDIMNKEVAYLVTWLEKIIDEDNLEEDIRTAEKLLHRLELL